MVKKWRRWFRKRWFWVILVSRKVQSFISLSLKHYGQSAENKAEIWSLWDFKIMECRIYRDCAQSNQSVSICRDLRRQSHLDDPWRGRQETEKEIGHVVEERLLVWKRRLVHFRLVLSISRYQINLDCILTHQNFTKILAAHTGSGQLIPRMKHLSNHTCKGHATMKCSSTKILSETSYHTLELLCSLAKAKSNVATTMMTLTKVENRLFS